MDPISQGAVGAVFAQSATSAEKIRAYAIFGCLAGMAPDLDIFIQSSTDPLLFLEYHRHFTHALVFIPFGAAIVAAVLFKLLRHKLTWWQAYFACLIGYATHGLLDACTSYGTQLFWPFSTTRVAWNHVSVVDPLFTLPLLLMVVISLRKHSRRWAAAGVLWIVCYLSFGLIQHNRAIQGAQLMAAQQGHTPERLTVKPGFGNLLLWKSIYAYNGVYHVDAIRVGTTTEFCPGDHVDIFDAKKHLPELDLNSQQARDIERFRWFSDNYLAPFGEPGNIIDVRYAAVPNDINPLWGIRIDSHAGNTAHVAFVPNRRTSGAQTQALLDLLAGKGCAPINSQLSHS